MSKTMGEEKILGKIDFAEYGSFKDRPFLLGLQLGFSFLHGGVMDGGKFTLNLSDSCRWDDDSRKEAIFEQAMFLRDLLKEAKCNYVSELVGKPVEVTLQNNMFQCFRILTEVL